MHRIPPVRPFTRLSRFHAPRAGQRAARSGAVGLVLFLSVRAWEERQTVVCRVVLAYPCRGPWPLLR